MSKRCQRSDCEECVQNNGVDRIERFSTASFLLIIVARRNLAPPSNLSLNPPMLPLPPLPTVIKSALELSGTNSKSNKTIKAFKICP
jgi:hypothetical protein